MFRLRARVFRDRLGWDVQVVDGKEHDKYDDFQRRSISFTPTKMPEDQNSLRLLPLQARRLLLTSFPIRCQSAIHLSAPTIWECTRFCLEDGNASGRSRREELIASGVLIAALGDVAIQAGIESVLGNFDSTMLRLYRRIGCDVEVLGSTERYGQPVYLQVVLDIGTDFSARSRTAEDRALEMAGSRGERWLRERARPPGFRPSVE